MEPFLPGYVQDMIQLGMGGAMFLVWYFTFKMSNNTHEHLSTQYNETYKKLAENSQIAYKDALAQQQEQNKQLVDLIRQNNEIHTHTARVLTRIEEKLDQPVRCPMNFPQRTGTDK